MAGVAAPGSPPKVTVREAVSVLSQAFPPDAFSALSMWAEVVDPASGGSGGPGGQHFSLTGADERMVLDGGAFAAEDPYGSGDLLYAAQLGEALARDAMAQGRPPPQLTQEQLVAVQASYVAGLASTAAAASSVPTVVDPPPVVGGTLPTSAFGVSRRSPRQRPQPFPTDDAAEAAAASAAGAVAREVAANMGLLDGVGLLDGMGAAGSFDLSRVKVEPGAAAASQSH